MSPFTSFDLPHLLLLLESNEKTTNEDTVKPATKPVCVQTRRKRSCGIKRSEENKNKANFFAIIRPVCPFGHQRGWRARYGRIYGSWEETELRRRNLIVRAFKLADTSSSGKLDTDEFLVAYEAMFNSDLDGSDDSHEENFIRCTRYGIDKSSSPAKVLFQSYTGTMISLTKRTHYSDDKSKSKKLKENE